MFKFCSEGQTCEVGQHFSQRRIHSLFRSENTEALSQTPIHIYMTHSMLSIYSKVKPFIKMCDTHQLLLHRLSPCWRPAACIPLHQERDCYRRMPSAFYFILQPRPSYFYITNLTPAVQLQRIIFAENMLKSLKVLQEHTCNNGLVLIRNPG